MRAVALVGGGEVAVLDDVPEPDCGADDVLVAVGGVGLCGSDLAVVSGERAVPALPWVLGHEAVGTIVAVGGAVTDRHAGQRVVVEPNYPCLHCGPCRSGATASCVRRRAAGITEPGLLAERVAVPARFCWPVGADLADEDAVCVEPFTVALGAARLAGARPGQRCLVVGAGSQGLLVCLALSHLGAIPVVTDPQPGRLALAESLGAVPLTGAASTLGSLAADGPAGADAGDGERFGVVVETSGVAEAFTGAVERAAVGGTVVVVGQSRRAAAVSTFTLVQRRLTVRGCLIYDHPAGFADSLAALAGGGLRPGRVLRGRFGLAEAPRAFAEAASVPGKSWISMEGSAA
jgi:threonine dehydrogenase-like Zn-dependent dehydrogenase